MLGRCALCSNEAHLEHSHIIPSFVFKWLKKNGPIRHAENINRRVQDGDKIYLLCRNCEQAFGRYETYFANSFFHPINSGDGNAPNRYDSSLLKFCCSVSWRTLTYILRFGRISHFSDAQQTKAQVALDTWRQFLLGQKPHPDVHEQHLLLFDLISDTTVPDLPPNFNRYLVRGVEMDAGCNSRSAFVFSKLGRFAIFGFIDVENKRDWAGSKIHVKSGLLNPKRYELPGEILGYLKSRAAKTWSQVEAISDNQQKKIESNLLANADKFVDSDVFRATQRDIEMFGKRAFSKKDDAS